MGDELGMPTFVSVPRAVPTDRVDALRANPDVAITIHTEGFPSQRSDGGRLTVTGLLVVLGAVLRSTAATVTTAVAVLFAPPILEAWCPPAHRDGPGLHPGRTE